MKLYQETIILTGKHIFKRWGKSGSTIKDANGATVSSKQYRLGILLKNFYSYAVWDLTEFNNRYGTNARAYKG